MATLPTPEQLASQALQLGKAIAAEIDKMPADIRPALPYPTVQQQATELPPGAWPPFPVPGRPQTAPEPQPGSMTAQGAEIAQAASAGRGGA